MFNIKDVYRSIEKDLRSIHNYEQELQQRMSEADKLINALYHEIEFSIFNAREGYKKAKKLQDILKERRMLKMEIAKINSLNASANINKTIELFNRMVNKVDSIETEHKKKYPSLA